MAPNTLAPSNGTTSTFPKLVAAKASYNGTLQSRSYGTASIPPKLVTTFFPKIIIHYNGTLGWDPLVMAHSNGTTSTESKHTTMAPAHWHHVRKASPIKGFQA